MEEKDDIIFKFHNSGFGDGTFLTRHTALVQELKQFDPNAFKLLVENIPGASCGGYNYTIRVKEGTVEEEINSLLQRWSRGENIRGHLDYCSK